MTEKPQVCRHGIDVTIKLERVEKQGSAEVHYFSGQTCFECLLDQIGRPVLKIEAVGSPLVR